MFSGFSLISSVTPCCCMDWSTMHRLWYKAFDGTVEGVDISKMESTQHRLWIEDQVGWSSFWKECKEWEHSAQDLLILLPLCLSGTLSPPTLSSQLLPQPSVIQHQFLWPSFFYPTHDPFLSFFFFLVFVEKGRKRVNVSETIRWQWL